MISAGRVLLMPRGAYDNNTPYEILDLVSYNGSSYVAKGPTKGNLPTDTTYWQLSAYGGNAANVAGNFAVIEITSVATVQHLEGTLFVDESSQFMKATQTINVGDSIVSGTNCTPTTVEQLINEVTAYVDGLDSKNRKLYGGTEIAAQTDLHSLAIGEYYKSRTTFYVTNGPDGISNVTSAVFRLTIEAALKDGSTASSPLLLTLRTPGGKIYTQNFDGSIWGEWTILSEQIEAAENGISDIVNILGAKNLLKIESQTTSVKGVTVTDNGDGSITVDGTPTADAYFNIMQHDFGNLRFATDGSADNSEYKLSGLPSNDKFYIAYNPSNKYVTLTVKTAYGAVDNVTVYPMIRPKNIEDDTWQPYTKTNKELTEEVTQNSSDIQTLTNNVATNAADIQTLTNEVDENTTDIQTLTEEVAPVNTSNTTADRAYTKGEQFSLGGLLCKALTDIASGATLTLSSNYARVPSLAQQISQAPIAVTAAMCNSKATPASGISYYSKVGRLCNLNAVLTVTEAIGGGSSIITSPPTDMRPIGTINFLMRYGGDWHLARINAGGQVACNDSIPSGSTVVINVTYASYN